MQQQYFNFTKKELVKISEEAKLEIIKMMATAILESCSKENKNGDEVK